jgi:hypothetical protein
MATPLDGAVPVPLMLKGRRSKPLRRPFDEPLAAIYQKKS